MQLVRPGPLAHRVEPSGHHSGLPLQSHQEAVQGVGGRCDSFSQTVRPLPRDGLPQALQPGRVLAHQELHGEVEGVQNAREGGDKGLLGLDAAHLNHGDLHASRADDGLLVHTRYGEVAAQGLRRLGPLSASPSPLEWVQPPTVLRLHVRTRGPPLLCARERACA